MVGGMGHTSMTSFAISKFTKEDVVCFDGDGSFIMHLGALTTVGKNRKSNFKYLMVDNGAHESIGGQPIDLKNLNIKNLAVSMGFKNVFYTNKISRLNSIMKKFIKSKGPSFFHIRIKIGTLNNLVRQYKILAGRTTNIASTRF